MLAGFCFAASTAISHSTLSKEYSKVYGLDTDICLPSVVAGKQGHAVCVCVKTFVLVSSAKRQSGLKQLAGWSQG